MKKWRSIAVIIVMVCLMIGGSGGTLTNDTFTIKCYPVSDPDCIFKA